MPQQIDIVANLLMKVDGAESGLKKLQSSLSGLKLPKGLDSDLKKSMSNLEGLFATYRKQIEKGFDTKSDVSAFTKTAKSVNAEYDRITRTLDKLNNTNVTFNIKSDSIKKVEQDLDNVIKKRDQLSADTQKSIAVDLANIQKAGSRSTKVQDYSNMLGVAIDKGQWQEALRLAQLLKTQFEGLSDKTKQAFATMSNGKSATAALDDIIAACRKGGEGFDKLEKEGKEAAELLASLQAKDLEQIEKALAKMGGEWQESTNGAKALNGEMTELARSTQSMSQQLGDLQQSTQYFFSLRNMINLLKRGISDAVQTVKELDKAMTETAVVTDFSVGDMWAKLPEYTANANKLGATIQDMYESTTLYYQQGLNTQQSMAIATETMKMARIAGLEAKDATDMMTAALRGFNMELNETSAERINDVYSNLAAKTASDTEEIGKAMQRTASIAHSAGMSFEGTAAFLAQAVETTREPAENIGTAMKTIVARFQEMKKNPLEITEVDGEEVSYNKVDEALQSIGVSLKDTNGQFRELDKVFLDISKRWDSLSQTQQRYIATIAAGSRQQSRFIAMMGDYDRTVELMSYANDSAGASQEQFNKTLDSLEAKINKFQNAWDQFLMGIMNDSWVKGLVDAGTTILKTVNGIIDALSFGGKAKGLKSLLSIGTAGVALKAGGNLINKLIGGVGGFIDPASSFGKGFWGAGKTTQEGTPATGVAGKITTPIVAKLNELIAVTREANNLKNINAQTTSTLGQYKNVSAMLRNPNSLNVKDVETLFNGLSDEHAYTAFRNAPGTITAMKQAVAGQLPAEMQSVGGQLMTNIIRGMKKKEIPVKKGAELIGKPQLWGKYLGTETAQEFSKQYITSQKELWKTQTIDAKRQAWIRAGGSAFATDEGIQDYLIKNKESDFTKTFISNYKQIREEMEYLSKTPIKLDKFQQLANNVGTLGSRFSSAGMSLQMFGSQLGQLSPALEGVGTLIARIGGMLSTFGMGISGIGSIVTGVGSRISTAVKLYKATSIGVQSTGKEAASNFMAGLTNGLPPVAIGAAIAAAVVGGLLIAKNIVDKKAREAGEEVRENFEQGFTETNKKIDSISDYKDRFNELSQGVDQFGHNINLTDEEFDEYLTISRELQELSPSLISGYNAEGQAILRKGAALDEVIDKLKEERDLSLRDYITDDSIGKLIGEYNTSDAYKNHNTIKMGDSGMGDAFESEKSSISKAIKEAELEWSDFSQILDELGIGGAESINDLTNQQLSMITAHYTDIVNKIKEFNPQIEEEVEDGLKEAFAETSNALEDILTEGAPIVDALRQWMGQEKLDAVGLGLSEEFVSGFNSGLDGLMLEGLTNNWKPEEYKTQLRDYANEWEHLAGPTSTYSTILTEADKIQQQYLDHIGEDNAIQNYENDVEGLANQLELLAEQYKGTGTAGEIFAEQCQQQANNLRNYATEGVISLSEALNTLSDEFASARGAQERFQKATEGGDYYTAAEGYKSIIDTMLDEKNTVGNGSDGSLTFWAGADELLGQKYVDSHTANEVIKQVEKIKGCFEDGLPGIQQFGDLLVENADKLKGLGEINEDTGQFEFNFKNLDDLEKYAELLGMSEDALAALIDKSRQYVPWNLSDPGAVRKAIEDSQYSMAGVSTRGENLVYTSESQFRAEARQQGIRGDDYTKTRSDAEERGVRFLNVENLTAKKGDGLYADQVLENIGLKGQDKTVENAVAAFTKMGLDLEDTKQVLMSDGIKLANGEEATAENIEKAYNEQAYELENPTVAGIANDTGTLVSNTSAMLAAMGILTEDAKKDIDKATSEETTQGYIDNLQNASSLNERNTARTTMEDKVSEYNALANKLVEAGRSETDPYVQKLRGAADALQTELDAEAKNWNDKAVAANQYLKENNIIPQSATTEEQQVIQMHAVDLQSAIETGDVNTVVETLKQIETEGNLSIETMVALGQSVSDLGAVDSSSILHFISEYQEKLKLARQESDQPFEIQTKFTGEKLEDHINAVKEFTTQEYAFLVRADVSGDEKVSTLINSINQEFGNGDQETKTILIDAVAKTANGDKEGAHDILAEAFGEDKAETIEKKIDVLCDGSVANKDDVIKALENELGTIPLNVDAKVNATASVDSLKATGGTVHYSTEVDTQGIDDAKAKADGTTGTIKIGGDNKEAKKAADAAKTYADGKTGNITINAVKGTGWNGAGWSINVSAHKRGRNYSIPASPSISFGSAAQGMNIPKSKKTNNSQVTALVGEEGFEVGYIPSERRSVIFGANGPEMTSFPSDTIIYPHGQSKKILRRGKGSHATAGSFAGGNTGSSGGIPTTTSGGGGGSTGSTSKAVTKAANDARKAVTTAAIKVGKVSVWWENIARKTESVQRKADQAYTKFEKYIKSMEATLKTTGTKGGGNAYIQNMSKVLGYNQAQYNKANKQLKNLDKSNKKTTIKYKQGKKEKTSKVKLGNYIKYDPASGTYIIDQKKINKVAGSKKLGGKARAQAIKEAAEKKINDKLSKRNKAEDAINKTKEALDKFGEQLYETFFAWEISLTKIWNLTQKIEAAQNKISRTDTMTDLLEKQLTSGRRIAGEDTAKESLQLFKERLEQQNQVIAERSKAIQQAQEDVLKAQTNTDEKAELEFIQKKLQDDAKVKASIENETLQKELQSLEAKSKLTKAEKDRVKKLKELIENNNKIIGDEESLTAAKRSVGETGLNETERLGYEQAEKETISKLQAIVLAKQFGSVTNYGDGTIDVNFDRDALDQARLEGQITETEAKYIEEYYTKLTESSANLGDIINSLGEDVIGYHDSLINLQDQWADYESQLIQINEEKNRKELDNLKKLSDSVKQTLDQLLDDVKRKLDERRKQEDNAKTEQDISKKQQRLAALRADTSGGHQVEIAQLEKEIADAQQDYQRSLEDQLIDKLQYQADEAAKQRERQIQLQEELATTTNNIAQVQEWMANPSGHHDELLELYREQKDYYKTGEANQKRIDAEFEGFYNGLLTNQKEQAELNKKLDTLTPILQDLTTLQQSSNTPETINEDAIDNAKSLHDNYSFSYSQLRNDKGYTAEQFAADGVDYKGAREAFSASELLAVEDYKEEAFGEIQDDYTAKLNDVKKNKKITTSDINKLFTFGKDIDRSKAQVIMDIVTKDQFTGLDPFTWKNTIKQLINADGITRYNLVKTWPNNKYLAAAIKLLSGKTHPNTIAGIQKHKNYKNAKNLYGVYKTGGLADYTGPAWLDGTPSKPELVLNAKDTANFVALKDVLAKAMNSIGDTSNTYGDIMYEININVDKIEKDYDVDRVVDKVKKEIIKGAGYRNVTQVRNLR